MDADLSPRVVAERLAALRARYAPESVADAYARLARERPADTEPFERQVARRLAELRALDDLARHLAHRVTRR